MTDASPREILEAKASGKGGIDRVMLLIIRHILLVLLLLATPALAADPPAPSGRWDCTITAQHRCSESGCEPVPIRTSIKINFKFKQFAYCRESKCIWQYARITISNPWITIDTGNGATQFKVHISGLRFLDFNGGPSDAMVAFGTCKEAT